MDTLGEGRLPQSLGLGESRFPQSSFLSIAAGFAIVSGSLYLLTASWSPQQDIETESSTPAPVPAVAKTETLLDVALMAQAPGDAEPEAEADGGNENLAAEAPPTSQNVEESANPSPVSPPAQDTTPTFGVAPIAEAEPIEAETIVSKSMRVSDESMAPEDVPEIPALPETAAAESADLETPVAVETTAPATDQIGRLIAESPTSLVSTRTIREDTGDVPDRPLEVSAAPSDSIDGTDTAASPETTAAVAPRSSQPQPKPEPPTARETARSAPPSQPAAQEQKHARPAAQQAQAQPRNGLGLRLPMGLAPANKPVTAPAAKPRLSGPAYSRKVWSALARSKPRAGQKGSATVVFTIGAGGSLGSARVARSSGNSRIDQLALATVRRAAPFPAPPSGGTSFSIRIDFQ